jgi:hypothetical protein
MLLNVDQFMLSFLLTICVPVAEQKIGRSIKVATHVTPIVWKNIEILRATLEDTCLQKGLTFFQLRFCIPLKHCSC